jgi:6-pyruvoyltetrahydropterin/6-carboxytetrahydropterin synthase
VIENFHVRVAKDFLVFSAGHFITYDRDKCERLHGHNWRAAVEVEGPLDENRYVVDFIALRDIARSIVDGLDHRMLLPASSPRIKVTERGRSVQAVFADREWIFPREDCVILPIENTTTELIAQWMAGRIAAELERRSIRPTALRVEVEENFGQSATYERRLSVPDP